MQAPRPTNGSERACDRAMLLIGVMVAALHRLAWASHPPDTDSIDLTLALHRFNLAQDAPDPPGYALYVLAGRAASLLVGDAHAYQAVNLLMLLGTGVCIYAILRRFGAPLVGLFTALLFMTHPLVFAATVIPEVYIAEPFFATLIVLCAARPELSVRSRIGQAVLLFVAIGFMNPLTGLLLLPLIIGITLLFDRAPRWQHAAAVGLAAAGATAAALACTIWLAGGLGVYRDSVARFMGQAFHESSVFGGAPLQEHIRMVAKLSAWFIFFAGPGALLAGIAKLARRKERPPTAALAVLAFWITPTFAYFALIHYVLPASQLIYLPCLILPLAWGAQHALGGGLRRLVPIGGGLIATAQLVFFFAPQRSEPVPIFRLTRGYTALQDREFDRVEDVLRQVPKDGTLALFDGHPTLSMYALRLMDRDAGSAIINDDNRTASYFEPETLQWMPSTGHDDLIDARFSRVVVIHRTGGEGAVDVVELAPGQSRYIPDVLARVHADAVGPPAR